MAHQPSKYNRQYDFPIVNDIQGVVRFDKPQSSVTRFVVQLQWLTSPHPQQWESFAQIDHEPANPKGHDLYREGIHVDIYHDDGTRSTIQPTVVIGSLPSPTIALLYKCKQYLVDNYAYFEQAAENQISLKHPPSYP